MRTLKIYFTLFVLVSAGLQVSPASALSHGCPYAAPPGAVAPGQLNPTLQHVLHWTLTDSLYLSWAHLVTSAYWQDAYLSGTWQDPINAIQFGGAGGFSRYLVRVEQSGLWGLRGVAQTYWLDVLEVAPDFRTVL